MLVIIGYTITILCVFGGFVMEGGSLYALLQPLEFLIIMGAAVGSFVVANSPKVIKASFRGAFSTLRGASFSRKFYVELLSFLYEVTNKIRKDGILSIESDIENYKESALFNNYPLLMRQPAVMEFACDHLRLMLTGRVDVMHLEEIMDQDIETFEHESQLPISAITKVADSLPAFGIVAAVMGVVITMQMISSSPEVLGEHVAKALVGTFLGVLIGYAFTAPIAAIMETKLQGTIMILQAVKVVLLASAHNIAPQIGVEFARKVLYSTERPDSKELEEILRDVKAGSRGGASAEAK